MCIRDSAYLAPHDGVLGVDAAGGGLANDTGVAVVAELWTEPTSGDVLLAALPQIEARLTRR